MFTKSQLASKLTGAIHSERVVICYSQTARRAHTTTGVLQVFLFTLMVGKRTIGSVVMDPTGETAILYDGMDQYIADYGTDLEALAKRVRTLPGFKLSKHEQRLATQQHPTPHIQARVTYVGNAKSPSVYGRVYKDDETFISQSEARDIVDRANKWLEVHAS